MQVYEFSKITSNSIGMNITLGDLLDQPIQTKTAKQYLCTSLQDEGDYVYNCYTHYQLNLLYIALKISNQGELMELYNRWPGQIDEVFIKENDLIGLDSILYNIKSEFRQDQQVEFIQYGFTHKRNQNIRINIIKSKEDFVSKQGDTIPLDPKIILGHKENVFIVEMNDGKTDDINILVMKTKYPQLVVQYLEKL